MKSFESLQPNQVGLISQDENGIIYQIALTQEQSTMINAVVSMISKETPLIRLPKEYDLHINTFHTEMLEMLKEIDEDGHNFSGWDRLESIIKKATEL